MSVVGLKKEKTHTSNIHASNFIHFQKEEKF
jgi:hypothetical protein